MHSSTWVFSPFRSMEEMPPFIAAAVPTFMKNGVSIAPCGVLNTPRRARPSVFFSSNMSAPYLSLKISIILSAAL